MRWNIAMRPGKRKLLDKACLVDSRADQLECLKARIRAKVEHPFCVIKRQFEHVKVRYRGLAKNTAQLHTLFALSNLWLVRGRSRGRRHECSCTRLKGRKTGPRQRYHGLPTSQSQRICVAAPRQHISTRITQRVPNRSI